MTRLTLSAMLLGMLALAGCTTDGSNMRRSSTQAQAPTSDPPVNPYSEGGYSDLGPNYPPTGH